ncbi:hypothetical protein MNEG_11955 [Monoraphidium neglectum]|uniref:DUF4485 domain-containing protein n=1 Tax=Monoraphidium neglectum TaxID=145388 RepID=A0A0D2J8C1_9CHLO|nr:hypothetical protein MNEG_11955 [Monoraphidium neglectum]KIY96007.1 hypothetical protein MNEG_11955 [Monoraphidium neglectum]|eukprot:XP_013895027.1 hypothetical protein MNEG_11955 [Monoraphidium neglectum]
MERDEYEAGLALDEQFLRLAITLEKRLALLDRHARVRVQAWLKKLRQETSNHTWKRSRNQYARLLLEQLRAGVLEPPFHLFPPEGALPTLALFLTSRRGRRQEEQEDGRGDGGSPSRGAAAPQRGRSPGAGSRANRAAALVEAALNLEADLEEAREGAGALEARLRLAEEKIHSQQHGASSFLKDTT